MFNVKHNNRTMECDKYPDTCPICHTAIKPIDFGSNWINKEDHYGGIFQVIFSCPVEKCQRAFIGTYRKYKSPGTMTISKQYFLNHTSPYSPQEPDIHEEIVMVSLGFKKIFTQSMSAEQYGLDQIAGAGYRKALEFLIKDYIINQDPKKQEEIEGKFLGKCIKEDIEDENIRICATGAAWLGNDETHFVRKWEEKDITDLKNLIQLTQYWIISLALTNKHAREMKINTD